MCFLISIETKKKWSKCKTSFKINLSNCDSKSGSFVNNVSEQYIQTWGIKNLDGTKREIEFS